MNTNATGTASQPAYDIHPPQRGITNPALLGGVSVGGNGRGHESASCDCLRQGFPHASQGVGLRQASEVLGTPNPLGYLARALDGAALDGMLCTVPRISWRLTEEMNPLDRAAAGIPVAAQPLAWAAGNTDLDAPVTETDRIEPDAMSFAPMVTLREHAQGQRSCVSRLATMPGQENDGAHGSGGLFAKNFPCDVRAQFFTGDDFTAPFGLSFDQRAVLSRHSVLQPRLDGLMSMPRDIEDPSGLHGPPEDRDRPLGSGLANDLRGVLHSPQCTQDFLSMANFLAFRELSWHEKLADMNIHEAIKTRREALGLTKTELARRVSEIHPEDPITRQTIQHWEAGKAAPKRSRMAAVARALETTLGELNRDDPLTDGTPEGRRALSLLDSLWELKELHPEYFEQLVSSIQDTLASLRKTDQLLRSKQDVDDPRRLSSSEREERSRRLEAQGRERFDAMVKAGNVIRAKYPESMNKEEQAAYNAEIDKLISESRVTPDTVLAAYAAAGHSLAGNWAKTAATRVRGMSVFGELDDADRQPSEKKRARGGER